MGKFTKHSMSNMPNFDADDIFGDEITAWNPFTDETQLMTTVKPHEYQPSTPTQPEGISDREYFDTQIINRAAKEILDLLNIDSRNLNYHSSQQVLFLVNLVLQYGDQLDEVMPILGQDLISKFDMQLAPNLAKKVSNILQNGKRFTYVSDSPESRQKKKYDEEVIKKLSNFLEKKIAEFPSNDKEA